MGQREQSLSIVVLSASLVTMAWPQVLDGGDDLQTVNRGVVLQSVEGVGVNLLS